MRTKVTTFNESEGLDLKLPRLRAEVIDGEIARITDRLYSESVCITVCEAHELRDWLDMVLS